MIPPRIIYIEFGGDPSDDKEVYKRYSSTTKFKPIFPECEVMELIETRAIKELSDENKVLKDALNKINVTYVNPQSEKFEFVMIARVALSQTRNENEKKIGISNLE